MAAEFRSAPRDMAEVSELIGASLDARLDSGRAYRLTLRGDLRGTRTQLRDYAATVAREILKCLSSVHEGTTLVANWPDREWRFREESAHDRNFTEPSKGVIYETNVPRSELDEGQVSSDFAGELQRLIDAAACKFSAYPQARRILVIEPYADARWSTDVTWRSLFSVATVPAEVEQVWLSMHAMITEVYCGWIHKPLWPKLGESYSELCRDPEQDFQ